MLNSSTQLLEQLNYDGIADMPFPSRNSIYLATFPFTDRDVKKWSWLFAHGVEETYLIPGGSKGARDNGDDDDDDSEAEFFDGGRYGPRVYRNRRRGSFDGVDVASVYLSRALDTTIVPEDGEKLKYLVVVQNRGRSGGKAKLLTAESRKAAGIIMYYEALNGNSIAFVGAVVGGIGKKAKKFKRVEGVDEVSALREKGVVGVIC